MNASAQTVTTGRIVSEPIICSEPLETGPETGPETGIGRLSYKYQATNATMMAVATDKAAAQATLGLVLIGGSSLCPPIREVLLTYLEAAPGRMSVW
ncbi:hypothetical protein [Mesorhizobium sp. STM 4661]|uniref:hypothetical protein n=1 Tax=Mesorhizobium sp. STM 4661 TaxID=1297570 RepID=UPI0018DED5CC|nr:hypothetical protein [Mesorhizobium sp. STM 4661]